MKRKVIIVISLVLTGLFFNCGSNPHEQNSTSSIKTISTDLPDEQGNLSQIKMYWVTEGKIFRGICGDNRFVIKPNCMNGVTSMPFDVFKKELDNGLAATAEGLFINVIETKQAIEVLHQKLAETVLEIVIRENQLNVEKQNLAAAKAEIEKLIGFIEEYENQLVSISQRLQKIRNSDLDQQAGEMADELFDLASQVVQIQEEIPDITVKIYLLTEEITLLSQKLHHYLTILDNLNNEYRNTAINIMLVTDDLASYQETIMMLTDPDGINYRVHASDAKFEHVRIFVKRFEAIFNNLRVL